MQQRWFKSCRWNRMNTVCVSTGSTEASGFVPCPTMASSKADVTSGGKQDFSQNTSILRTQPHVAHFPKHHGSHWAHLHPPNLGASGLSPQPWFRDLAEFKSDEFSPNILDFQKHPGKLYNPVRADLHPLSSGSLPCKILPLFQRKAASFQKRGLIWASAKDGDGMRCCRDGGYQLLACRKAVRIGKGERSVAGKERDQGLRRGFLGSYSCRSISIPYLRDLWVIVYWPSAGIAALRAFSGCAGTFITWGKCLRII